MAVLVARQGRELQRYSKSTGGRIVVGCIPYRVRGDDRELEVLVISSRKGHVMMFPKGGWELDESMDEGARREALVKAGVRGGTGQILGYWYYRSRRYDPTKEGIMFPLQVTDELHQWPEMASRKRTWATVQQVMDGCPHWWMREALERLADRHANLQRYIKSTGRRIVVGCIPYRVRGDDRELEVLVISSQKGHGMMFPKGGWELDESMDDAARRVALEEAGVRGDTEQMLGQTYEGIMFPLQVTDELHQWPEMASRKRNWATVQQVMDGCQHGWMREALERLVARHAKLQSAL